MDPGAGSPAPRRRCRGFLRGLSSPAHVPGHRKELRVFREPRCRVSPARETGSASGRREALVCGQAVPDE